MPRQPPRGRRKRNTTRSPRRAPPPTHWLTRRPRSVSGGRVCSGGSDGTQLHVLDKFAAAVPQSPQHEAELFVVDKIGQSLAAGEAAVAHPLRSQELEIRDVRASPQPSAASNEFFTTGSSSSSLLQESGLTWQTVPVVEDAILHGLHMSQMTVLPQIVKQENLDLECHFPHTEKCNPNIKQELLSEKPAPLFRSKGTSTMRQGGSRRGLPRPGPSITEPATSMESSSYTRPPHPYEAGKVNKVNICPVCEKYTVTERERPADSDPSCEALRARFKCDLCRNVFDLGVTLFDPRGSPGVSLYQGDDRFSPPVPPRATYPCPRCWMSADTSFQCMTLYLKEETRVPCEPACPAGRMNLNLENSKSKTQKRKSMQQVMGWV